MSNKIVESAHIATAIADATFAASLIGVDIERSAKTISAIDFNREEGSDYCPRHEELKVVTLKINTIQYDEPYVLELKCLVGKLKKSGIWETIKVVTLSSHADLVIDFTQTFDFEKGFFKEDNMNLRTEVRFLNHRCQETFIQLAATQEGYLTIADAKYFVPLMEKFTVEVLPNSGLVVEYPIGAGKIDKFQFLINSEFSVKNAQVVKRDNHLVIFTNANGEWHVQEI